MPRKCRSRTWPRRSLRLGPRSSSSRSGGVCPAGGLLALAAWIGLLLLGSPAVASGPVVGWGAGLVPNVTASAIAAGAYHSCAIQAGTGAVVCWSGRNEYGQATPPPSVNAGVGGASAIVAGHFHTCAIQAGNGAVVCWGLN